MAIRRASLVDADALRDLVKLLHEATLNVSYPLGERPPPLESVEDVGLQGRVYRSKLVIPEISGLRDLVVGVEPREPPGEVLAVDGSSAPLDSGAWRLGLYSVAAAGLGFAAAYPAWPARGGEWLSLGGVVKPASLSIPGLWDPRGSTGEDRPALRLLHLDPLVSLREDSLLCGDSRRPRALDWLCKHRGYGRYNVKTMLDENRILLETIALHSVAEPLLRGSLLVADGPLYSTPGFLESLQKLEEGACTTIAAAARALYALSYGANSLLRMLLSQRLRGLRVMLAGVVKRLSSSRVLVHALKNSGVEGVEAFTNDLELVSLVLRDVASQESYRVQAMLIGPLLVEIRLGSALGKVRECIEGLTTGGALVGRGRRRRRTLVSFQSYVRLREDAESLLKTLIGDASPGRLGNLDVFPLGVDEQFKLYKAVGYLYVPINPWGHGRALYRVEVPVDESEVGDPERILERLKETASWLAWVTLTPIAGSLPGPLDMADKLAGLALKAITAPLYRTLRGLGVTFTYETEEVVASVLGRIPA